MCTDGPEAQLLAAMRADGGWWDVAQATQASGVCARRTRAWLQGLVLQGHAQAQLHATGVRYRATQAGR